MYNDSYWPILEPTYSNVISGYNVDLMTSKCGSLLTRSVFNQTTLNLIGAEINTLLVPSPPFYPKNAFVATWLQVCAYNETNSGTVSFQILISTDGNRTFLTLNYDQLEFNANQINFQYINSFSNVVQTPLPNSPQKFSNVNVTGKWIFFLSDGNFLYFVL